MCFNPTMVRLLPCQVTCHHRACGFQSHNGAIAAEAMAADAVVEVRFQSHNGAIAACGG